MTDNLLFRRNTLKKSIPLFMFLAKELRALAIWSSALCLLHCLVVAISFIGLQNEIPIFYSRPSEQQLAHKVWLFLLPSLATAIQLAHLSFAKALNNSRHIVEMLLQITLFLQVLAFAISMRIILII
jgi:hypothetical protein